MQASHMVRWSTTSLLTFGSVYDGPTNEVCMQTNSAILQSVTMDRFWTNFERDHGKMFHHTMESKCSFKLPLLNGSHVLVAEYKATYSILTILDV